MPGLDLHKERLLRHKLFIDIVHQNAGHVAAFGWHCYARCGRGAVFINDEQWKEGIKRGSWTDGDPRLSPFAYLPVGVSPETAWTELWRRSYEALVLAYDPERHVLLLVETPPEPNTSLYLLETDPAPPEAYEITRDRVLEQNV